MQRLMLAQCNGFASGELTRTAPAEQLLVPSWLLSFWTEKNKCDPDTRLHKYTGCLMTLMEHKRLQL